MNWNSTEFRMQTILNDLAFSSRRGSESLQSKNPVRNLQPWVLDRPESTFHKTILWPRSRRHSSAFDRKLHTVTNASNYNKLNIGASS